MKNSFILTDSSCQVTPTSMKLNYVQPGQKNVHPKCNYSTFSFAPDVMVAAQIPTERTDTEKKTTHRISHICVCLYGVPPLDSSWQQGYGTLRACTFCSNLWHFNRVGKAHHLMMMEGSALPNTVNSIVSTDNRPNRPGCFCFTVRHLFLRGPSHLVETHFAESRLTRQKRAQFWRELNQFKCQKVPEQ